MSYHGSSLRKCRYSETGRPYLITTVTHSRKPVFSNFDIARLLIHELRTSNEKLMIESLAWVVMPDHLHWLFVLNQSTVSEVVRHVKGKSAHSINTYRSCSGAVWQHGFHDHAIRIDEDIKTVARYIIANPLRAGLVDNIGDYPLWDAVWL
jgi:REP element-mobilizing transposase RayT